MITEISPIFGLSLLELFELSSLAIPIAIIAAACITGGLSYWSIRQSKTDSLQNKKQMVESKKQMAKQLKLQNNIASAQLAWNILEYWRESKHEGFTDFLKKLHRSEIDPNDENIGVTLNIFEDIAILWHEKTLTDNHVKEFFGNPLRDIRESPIMQEKIKKVSAQKPELFFANLRPLLEKTREWGF